jgi:hypothetical protein
MYFTSRKVLSTAIVAAALVIGILPAARADVFTETNYQGFLRDNSNQPVNASVNLSFLIFDAETGGTPIWSENQGSTAVEDGVFSVLLGSITPLTSAVLDGSDRWLETSVDGSPISPRRKFAATPYAMRAAVAETVINGGEDDDWVIDGANVYRVGGNVGIGTSTPTQELHVESSNVTTDLIVAKTGTTTLKVSAQGTIGAIGTTTNDPLRFIANNSTRMHVGTDGNVGIGTVSPLSKLSVNGDLDADVVKVGNALGETATPEVGGVYRDNIVYAWAKIRGDGVIEESFGLQSAQRTFTGSYRLTLKRSLPAGASAVVTPFSVNDPVIASISSLGGTNCEVKTRLYLNGVNGFQASDYRFFVQIVGRP